MLPLTHVRSRTIVLEAANIDTDQIIPARFLSTTHREDLGRFAFADWRAASPGTGLDDARARDASIIVAGRNFGCGSSREHAAWALADLGIRAVISTGIADLFAANAVKNGIVPVIVDDAVHAELITRPFEVVAIDVGERTVLYGRERCVPFPLDDFDRRCLVEGIDRLSYLLARLPDIEHHERAGAGVGA